MLHSCLKIPDNCRKEEPFSSTNTSSKSKTILLKINIKASILLLMILAVFLSPALAQENFTLFQQEIRVPGKEINSESKEFGPGIINKQLVFSRLMPSESITFDENSFYRLFGTTLNSVLTKKAQPSPFLNEIKTEYHQGPVSFCKKTSELFVTHSNSSEPETSNGMVRKRTVHLSIAIYHLDENNNWKFHEQFPFNKPNCSVGHPAINQNGDTLVFVSDRAGGKGKTDLYMSVKQNDSWQEPLNLGNNVNTRKNEITPFINQKGQLIFASEGHKGLGGFDLYEIKLKNFMKDSPKNLGTMLNSSKDEFGLCVHQSQLLGFFVTNRNRNKNNDDIYMFQNIDFDDILAQIEKEITAFNHKIKEAESDLSKAFEERFAQETKLEKVDFSILGKCMQQNIIPDLQILYSYQINNQKLYDGINVFNLTRYQLEHCDVLSHILSVMKIQFEQIFDTYLTNSSKLTVTINGNKDSFIFSDKIQYGGEFGDQLTDYYYKAGRKHKAEIKINDEITQDELAFLRAYAVKNFLISKLTNFNSTKHEFVINVKEDDQKFINDYSTVIQVDISNGFGILQNPH